MKKILNPPQPVHFRKLYSNKTKLKFLIFLLLCGASKGFMKAFKAFIKPFETPQGSVKIIFFSVRSGWRWEGLKLTLNITIVTNYDLCYSIFEDSENTENT